MSRRRILFVFWHPGQLRSFEGALSLMAERGHRLHVVFERPRERIPGQLDALHELAAAYENVTVQLPPKVHTSNWDLLVRRVRLGLDHLHYFHPRFAAAPEYRARAAEAAPSLVRRLARRPRLRPALGAALRGVERAAPVGALPTATIAEFAPDVVAVTPYVWFGASQTDWARAAHRRGIPVVASLWSWDNLTSKGSTRATPDLMTVWNEAQREEAAILHGVPPDRVEVTGAQVWDLWFDWQPSRDRETFLSEVGLSAGDGPLILYLESSAYVGNEESFAPQWVAALRGHFDERLRDASVLVRPHPQVNANNWEAVRSESPGRVAVWPPQREAVQDLQARQNFFDSLYHADACVGINTSAFIEAAIVGRPSLAPALSQFRRGQANTIHFAHLVEENGGPVRLASTLDEHADQLAEALRDPAESVERARAFVGRFVRPHGLREPATPRFVAALERAGTLTPAPSGGELGAQVLRLLMEPLALVYALRSPKRRRQLSNRFASRGRMHKKAVVTARAAAHLLARGAWRRRG